MSEWTVFNPKTPPDLTKKYEIQYGTGYDDDWQDYEKDICQAVYDWYSDNEFAYRYKEIKEKPTIEEAALIPPNYIYIGDLTMDKVWEQAYCHGAYSERRGRHKVDGK